MPVTSPLWSARLARVMVYLLAGRGLRRGRLLADPLGLAGSDQAIGSRLDAGGTPRRISRGRIVRLLE